MTPSKLREKIKIKLIKKGMDKPGDRNKIAQRIEKPASVVSMALSGYRDDIKTLNQIEEALDNWGSVPR